MSFSDASKKKIRCLMRWLVKDRARGDAGVTTSYPNLARIERRTVEEMIQERRPTIEGRRKKFKAYILNLVIRFVFSCWLKYYH